MHWLERDLNSHPVCQCSAIMLNFGLVPWQKMMLKFNVLFYFQHQYCISAASVSFSDDVSDEFTPEKQPRKRAPPKLPNPPAFSSSRSCQPKNSSRSNLMPQSTVQENDTLSSSIQNSSMDSSSGSHLSGNPRNPHYRPPSCAWENTSCSSESILPECVESSPGYLNAVQTAFMPNFNGKLKTLINLDDTIPIEKG